MPQIMRLTDVDGEPIFVNGANVRVVQPESDGGAAIIFDKDHKVFVKENAKEVVTLLSVG